MEFKDNEGTQGDFSGPKQLKIASIKTLKTLQSKLNVEDSDEAWLHKIFQKQIEIHEEKLKSRR